MYEAIRKWRKPFRANDIAEALELTDFNSKMCVRNAIFRMYVEGELVRLSRGLYVRADLANKYKAQYGRPKRGTARAQKDAKQGKPAKKTLGRVGARSAAQHTAKSARNGKSLKPTTRRRGRPKKVVVESQEQHLESDNGSAQAILPCR